MSLSKAVLVMLFLVSYSYSQVTASFSNLKINGITLNVNSINFNTQSTLQMDVNVNLSTFNGNSNNIFGNLFLFYKATNTSAEVQLAVLPVTFTVTYPPFVTQTTYNSVNYFSSITLNANSFYSSGGIIYAKYINNNGNEYLTSEIGVLGGSKTSNTDGSQTNTICCSQTVRIGDKPQVITASNFIYQNGIILSWIDENGNNLANISSSTLNSLEFDYIFENKNIRRRIKYFPANSAPQYSTSSDIDINVIPNPILSNVVFAQAAQISSGEYEVNYMDTIDLSGYNSFANPIIVSDPYHITNRDDLQVRVSDYQWQYSPYSINNRNVWFDILGATSSSIQSFLPENYTNNKFKIRRIAKYGNISLVSNVLSFIVRDSNISSNFICCDQSLTNGMSGVSVPDTLIGNDTQFSYSDGNIDINSFILNSYSVSYQWQYRSNSSNSTWQNLICQTKDCLPNILPTMPNSLRFYRRIAIVNYSISSIANPLSISSGSYSLYSNEVTIRVLGRGSRVAELNVNNDKNVVLNEFNISIYPNPANEKVFLNIKSSTSKKSQFKLRIFNNLGLIVYEDIINKKEQIDFPIDVSNLSSGLYYFEVEDENSIIISKKLLIE